MYNDVLSRHHGGTGHPYTLSQISGNSFSVTSILYPPCPDSTTTTFGLASDSSEAPGGAC